jgi:putative redox protein
MEIAMDVKLNWTKSLEFTGINTNGFDVPLGGTLDEGVKPDGFKPLELILIGLAGCTAMDVISILEKKKQKVNQFGVNVHAERAVDHPKVFTDIVVEYIFSGEDLDPEAVKRAIELSETKYCSAMAMLKKNSPIHTRFTITRPD